MYLRYHTEENPVEDCIDHIGVWKRGSIKEWGSGHRRRWERFQTQSFRVCLGSGGYDVRHSNIYRYLVSCITKQLKQVFRCLEKEACCFVQRHCGSDQNIFSVISSHTIFTCHQPPSFHRW